MAAGSIAPRSRAPVKRPVACAYISIPRRDAGNAKKIRAEPWARPEVRRSRRGSVVKKSVFVFLLLSYRRIVM